MSPRALDPAVHTAADVVALLGLEPLDQEGGFFRRTAEGSERAVFESKGERRAYSVIYGLFTPDGFSALHRLATDEIWCWHAGDALESLRLHPEGRGEWVRLGVNFAAGDRPHDVVPAGVWQGTRLAAGGRWALVSCVVAPEFRWTDFVLGDPAALRAAYPAWREAITALSREAPPVGAK